MLKKIIAFLIIPFLLFPIFSSFSSIPVHAASKSYNAKFSYSGKKYKVAVTYNKTKKKCGNATYYKYNKETKKYKKLSAKNAKKISKKSVAQKAKNSALGTCNKANNVKDSGGGDGKSSNKQSVSYGDSTFKGDCGSSFAGLIPWSCNVDITTGDNGKSLKDGIWTIVANIATDVTIIAAYLVIGFVIYGGYLYIMSNGDANKVASGKKTLTQAFIGLAIVMLANVILNTIRAAMGGVSFSNSTFRAKCAIKEGAPAPCADPGSIANSAITWVIGVAGVVAAIFVVIGGISYITSAGDSNKLQKAKQTILYALIGLIIVALAEVITAFVSNIIRDAAAIYINETTISKEVHDKTI